MIYRKPGKVFDFGFTGKRSHSSIGVNVAHFMAATIAYGKEVIAAEQ